MRMTRRLFSLFFLTLVLGTAGLQAACSESQSKTASNDSATEEPAGADESQDSGNTQVAAADTENLVKVSNLARELQKVTLL